MRARLPIVVALGASFGVIVAYLLAGGASYQPLQAADPCQPRSEAVLAERGALEGIVLSALDGAACELQVSREELTAALSGDQVVLDTFAARYDIDEGRIDEASRASLVRAVDDATREGRISGTSATIVRFIAERAPVAAALDVFRAIPGDPTPVELIEAGRRLGLQIDSAGDSLGDLLDRIPLP